MLDLDGLDQLLSAESIKRTAGGTDQKAVNLQTMISGLEIGGRIRR